MILQLVKESRNQVIQHEDCEQLCNTSVSSFSLKSSEWVNANPDTGDTVDIFLSNFDRYGVGDGISNDWITGVEALRFQGTDAHRVLGKTAPAFAPAPASEAVENVSNEQQDFHVDYDGGHMIQIHSKIC